MTPARSRTIYVDLDDVLCQTARHFLVIVEREFDKRVRFEELIDFDMGAACGLLPEERDALYRIVHEPDELLRMAPIAEAIAALGRWAEAGYEIAIVTGRPPDAYEPSRAWLAQHRVPHHSLTLADKYGRFETEHTHAISLRELTARAYCWAVEDSLPMARFLAQEMRVPVALLDTPWNRTGSEPAGVRRCRDWAEIASVLPQDARR